MASRLDGVQQLSFPNLANGPAINNPITIGWFVSKISILSYQLQLHVGLFITVYRNRTTSRRSEPNSRTKLLVEQTIFRSVMRLQDLMSRHRGAKPNFRSGLSNRISLLSPAYLLSINEATFNNKPRVSMAGVNPRKICLFFYQARHSHSGFSTTYDRSAHRTHQTI